MNKLYLTLNLIAILILIGSAFLLIIQLIKQAKLYVKAKSKEKEITINFNLFKFNTGAIAIITGFAEVMTVRKLFKIYYPLQNQIQGIFNFNFDFKHFTLGAGGSNTPMGNYEKQQMIISKNDSINNIIQQQIANHPSHFNGFLLNSFYLICVFIVLNILVLFITIIIIKSKTKKFQKDKSSLIEY